MYQDIPVAPIPLENIMIGMRASYSQTIGDFEIKQFAGLSGDHNPVHLDQEYAENYRFKKRIAHGMISVSFFSAIFGTKLPGPGCVYAGQNIDFKRPVLIGDTVTATVEVESIEEKNRIIVFKTFCKVKNKLVIDGNARIYIPNSKN